MYDISHRDFSYTNRELKVILAIIINSAESYLVYRTYHCVERGFINTKELS